MTGKLKFETHIDDETKAFDSQFGATKSKFLLALKLGI
jgi:hypothetical protein